MARRSTIHAVTTIGIDMGKNTLHMVGLDSRGAIVLDSRGRIASRLAKPATLPHWHRSGNGDALCCSRAGRAWPRCDRLDLSFAQLFRFTHATELNRVHTRTQV
jgi:hypothetical protein